MRYQYLYIYFVLLVLSTYLDTVFVKRRNRRVVLLAYDK